MDRRRAAVVFALCCGCFQEVGGTTAGEEGSGGSSGPGSGGSAESSSTSTSTGGTGSSGASSASQASDSASGSAGEEPPMPRAVWRFDGDLAEDIARADATAVGTVSFVASPSSMAAVPAASSYIDASAAGSLVLAKKDAFTVLMRLRLDDHVGNQMLWSLGPASDLSAERNAMALSALDGMLHLFTETGVAVVHSVDPAPAPAVGEWVTMVVVVDADFVRVFLDGALEGAASFVPVETSTTEFYLGGLLNTAAPAETIPIHGAIDELRFWDVVLDEDDVVLVSTP